MPATINCDVAIVGGGLAGGLIALALRRKRPDCDVRIVEGGGRIGGNHLWSFFATDVAPADRWLTAPLIGHGWTSYDVAFPAISRTLRTGYYSIESRRLDQVVRAELPAHAVMTRRKVLAASPTAVVLSDGDRIEAKGVIDCRGPADLAALHCGWQKFHGRELALAEAHGLARPKLMDATVEQLDGYRFVYALPFSPTCAFVEDTYYSDTPDFDAALLGARIAAYADAQGWQVDHVVREESGALPVVMGGDFEAYWQAGGNKVAKAGGRATPRLFGGGGQKGSQGGGGGGACSIRSPAMRCRMQCVPPRSSPRRAIWAVRRCIGCCTISPDRHGAAAISTACSPPCCSRPPNLRSATASSSASTGSIHS